MHPNYTPITSSHLLLPDFKLTFPCTNLSEGYVMINVTVEIIVDYASPISSKVFLFGKLPAVHVSPVLPITMIT